jgi:hypothetical protein
MGIEPTWDWIEPHAGFEDQERHQVAPHLRAGLLRRLQNANLNYCRRTGSHKYLARFGGEFQSELMERHP